MTTKTSCEVVDLCVHCATHRDTDNPGTSEMSTTNEIDRVDLEIRNLKNQHTLSRVDCEDLEILRSHRLHLQQRKDLENV